MPDTCNSVTETPKPIREKRDNCDESAKNHEEGAKETDEHIDNVIGASIVGESNGNPLVVKNGDFPDDGSSENNEGLTPNGQTDSGEDNEPHKGSSEGCFTTFKKEIVKLEWRMLILCVCFPLGQYFAGEYPSSLGVGKGDTIQARFFEQGKEYTQKMNQSLYTLTGYPCMVMSILGGILIDSIVGLRISMLLFASSMLAGAFLFYLGVEFTSYGLMMAGMLIQSFGGGNVCVALNAFMVRLFKGGHAMALAFGLSLSFLRLGSSVSFFVSPLLAEKHGVAFSTLVGVFVSAFAVCCGVALLFVDRYAEKKGILPKQHLGDTECDETTGEKKKISFKDRVKTICLQIYTLPPQLWLIGSICVFQYGALSFLGVAKNFFETKFGFTAAEGGMALAVNQFTCAIACPIVGFICDRIGRTAQILGIVGMCFAATNLLMIFTYIPPIASMIMLGLCYTFLVGALWPSVAYVVSPRVIGVSYGLMTALQSGGTAPIPLIMGVILDANLEDENAEGGPRQSSLIAYYYVEAFMICLNVVAMILSIVLLLVDKKKSGGIVTMGSEERRHIMLLRMVHPYNEMDCNEFHKKNDKNSEV